jgi:O-antigen/teichoic acid export membrane protein
MPRMADESRLESEPEPALDILDTPLAGPAAIRGAALRVGGYAVGIIVTVFSAALLFRHLGVVDSGRYVTVLSLVVIASGLVDFGLTTIGVRELAIRPRDEAHRFIRNLVGLRLALTAVGLAGAVVFAALAGYPSEMVLGTLLAGIGMLAAAAQGTLAANLMVELRLGWLTLIELMRQVIVAASITVLVLVGAGLVGFLATPIPAGFAVLAATVVLIRGDVPVMPAFDVGEWRAVLAQMLPYAAATALSAIYFRIAVILVSLFTSATDTGYFGASFRVVEVLLAIPGLIVSAAFPIFSRAARDDHHRFAYGVQRMYETGLLLGGWVAAVLIVGAPFVIEVIAGPEFKPAADLLRIQAVALLATFAGATFLYALLPLHRARALLALTSGALVLNVLLVSVLASTSGIEAAALGTVVAEWALMVGAAIYLGRVVPSLRIASPVVLRVVPAFVACMALMLIPGVPDAVLAAIAGLLFPAIAYVLGAVPEELMVELRKVLGGRRFGRR